jgi:hypothetical protein
MGWSFAALLVPLAFGSAGLGNSPPAAKAPPPGCTPEAAVASLDRLFDALAAGRPVRALREIHPDAQFLYVGVRRLDPRGPGLIDPTPQQVARGFRQGATRNSYKRWLIGRARRHDRVRILEARTARAGPWAEHSWAIFGTASWARSADDILVRRTVYTASSKWGYQCDTAGSRRRGITRIAGVAVVEGQRAQQRRAREVCPPVGNGGSRRVRSVVLCLA